MGPDCERYEIEIGMRQHGALDPAEEARLDAHLAGCASCRTFATAGGDIDSALKRHAEVDAAAVDWKKVEDGVGRLRRAYRRKLWLAPLFLLQVPIVFLLAVGQLPPAQLLAAAPSTVLLYLAYVWLVNRPFREVMAVVRSGEDLVVAYARELRRQALRARIFAAVNLALAIASLLAAVTASVGVRPRLYFFGCVLVFGAWAAYDLGVKLPRLRRALAEAGR